MTVAPDCVAIFSSANSLAFDGSVYEIMRGDSDLRTPISSRIAKCKAHYVLYFGALHSRSIWAKNEQVGLVFQGLLFSLSSSCWPCPCRVRLYSLKNNIQSLVC